MEAGWAGWAGWAGLLVSWLVADQGVGAKESRGSGAEGPEPRTRAPESPKLRNRAPEDSTRPAARKLAHPL